MNTLISEGLVLSRGWLALTELMWIVWFLALIVALGQGKGVQTGFLKGVEVRPFSSFPFPSYGGTRDYGLLKLMRVLSPICLLLTDWSRLRHHLVGISDQRSTSKLFHLDPHCFPSSPCFFS